MLLLLASACTGGDDEATRTVTVTTATTVTVTETTTADRDAAAGRCCRWTRSTPVPRASTSPGSAIWRKSRRSSSRSSAQENSSRSFQSTSNGGSASATLVIDGLGDDSVRARRYELTFTRRDDGTWRIDSATWTQRCHEGRGHQEFSAAPCL